uniref:DUF834 domain-containing protein n=1 Tax=Oryza glaberrima TaxID=4538 RepID=I1PVW3_ORYGL
MGIPAAWRTSVHGAADGWARRATRKAPSAAKEWGHRGAGASQTGVGGAADGGGCGPCDEATPPSAVLVIIVVHNSSTAAKEWRSGVGAAADEAPRRFLARVADLRRRRIMGFGGEARFLAWEWDNEATGRDATQGRTGEGMNAACGRSA